MREKVKTEWDNRKDQESMVMITITNNRHFATIWHKSYCCISLVMMTYTIMKLIICAKTYRRIFNLII